MQAKVITFFIPIIGCYLKKVYTLHICYTQSVSFLLLALPLSVDELAVKFFLSGVSCRKQHFDLQKWVKTQYTRGHKSKFFQVRMVRVDGQSGPRLD